MRDEQILAEEKAILSRDYQKKNLYSRMSLNDRDLISLEYGTWIKHMQKDFKSLRLCEDDAHVQFKRKAPRF